MTRVTWIKNGLRVEWLRVSTMLRHLFYIFFHLYLKKNARNFVDQTLFDQKQKRLYNNKGWKQMAKNAGWTEIFNATKWSTEGHLRLCLSSLRRKRWKLMQGEKITSIFWEWLLPHLFIYCYSLFNKFLFNCTKISFLFF